jgi:hypothetical protein
VHPNPFFQQAYAFTFVLPWDVGCDPHCYQIVAYAFRIRRFIRSAEGSNSNWRLSFTMFLSLYSKKGKELGRLQSTTKSVEAPPKPGSAA